ncbi:helix-turn-helix transcriptional regulator [Actinomadura sp. LOL_016]|uniref:helix-turn-helix domain-containing protein n=1 Tax=unclassified Actinomadura TaxID=2626254 RepID=UPI003A800432
MISPYVRRLRLAAELRDLRQAADLTHEKLAKLAGLNRQMISKLENGHVAPDQDDVLSLLNALGVTGDRWTELVHIANEAASRGWWESVARQIGERQSLFANLEAGAATIFEYAQAIIPGLLQTEAYTRARVEIAAGRPIPEGMTTAGILKGRATRQQLLRRSGNGPGYEAIIDAIAISRPTVPPAILREQLLDMVSAAKAEDRITVRVLPVDAEIEHYNVPLCPFSLYAYANGDPDVVAIEAVTTDVVLTDPAESAVYGNVAEALRRAALSVADSQEYMAEAAHTLPSDD